MIQFYQNLKSGSTVAVALNQAQTWLRDATKEQLEQWTSQLSLDDEPMLGLSELKKTRFYQEVLEEGKQEGKLETVPELLRLGLTSEQIAEALKLPLELVQQTAQKINSQTMSFSEQNVAAFIELLTHQRSLFTSEDLTELEQLVTPLADDIQEISKALSSWYKKHPEIREAQLKLLPDNSEERAPGSKGGKVKTPNYELNKQTLQNAVQQSSSSKGSQSSNSGS
jgi:hypothetical protein